MCCIPRISLFLEHHALERGRVGGRCERDKTIRAQGIRHQENPLNELNPRSIDPIPPPLDCTPQALQTARLLSVRGFTPHVQTMSEDHFSNQRKSSRSAITTTAPAKQLARPRPASPKRDTQDDDTRPAKRTRKAINCEPCRNSKLKCDRSVWIINLCRYLFFHISYRNRPCSSCVLRGECLFWSVGVYNRNLRFRGANLRCSSGTVASCYQGADGQPLPREDV